MATLDDVGLPDGWIELSPSSPGTDLLLQELLREISEHHPLFGKRLHPIARSTRTDDVVFRSDDPPTPYALVHLTWSDRREKSPECPETDFFASPEECWNFIRSLGQA